MLRRFFDLLAGLAALLVVAFICGVIALAGCVAPGPGEPSLVDALVGQAPIAPRCPDARHGACTHPELREETRTVCTRCGRALHGQEQLRDALPGHGGAR